jgi:Protein of unknown function (DUF3768)
MTHTIRDLNDLARTAMGVASRVVQTSGVAALDPALQSRIRERVETFDAFTPENDPYGEHDFGAFDIDGERIFWKIDYYDRTYTAGSEDPGDPAKTRRLLTIMLASEY